MEPIEKVEYSKMFLIVDNLCLKEKIQIMLYPDPEKIIKSEMWFNS